MTTMDEYKSEALMIEAEINGDWREVWCAGTRPAYYDPLPKLSNKMTITGFRISLKHHCGEWVIGDDDNVDELQHDLLRATMKLRSLRWRWLK